MPTVHPTALLDGAIQLADDVVVGPGCVLTGPISIGAGTVLRAGVHLEGPLTMGERNTVYPGACLGFPPQDLKFDPKRPGAGLAIGDGNLFREHVTIHRATREDRPTRIGHRNYWMANSHAGHDCQVGSDNIIANGVLLAGHVEVADRVVFGGNATIHQFVRIARGAMISGLVGIGGDLCPFFTVTDINLAGSLNIIGMRRSGMSRADIDTARWCYRTITRLGLPPKAAVRVLRERESDPLVREYIAFIESSKRYIVTGRGRRSGGPAASETAAAEA